MCDLELYEFAAVVAADDDDVRDTNYYYWNCITLKWMTTIVVKDSTFIASINGI